MPDYDFLCEKCGHQFVKYYGVNDDRKGLKCPECKSKKVERNFGNICLGNKSGTDRPSGCSSGSCSSCSGCS